MRFPGLGQVVVVVDLDPGQVADSGRADLAAAVGVLLVAVLE
jgi:hypothetical protein